MTTTCKGQNGLLVARAQGRGSRGVPTPSFCVEVNSAVLELAGYCLIILTLTFKDIGHGIITSLLTKLEPYRFVAVYYFCIHLMCRVSPRSNLQDTTMPRWRLIPLRRLECFNLPAKNFNNRIKQHRRVHLLSSAVTPGSITGTRAITEDGTMTLRTALIGLGYWGRKYARLLVTGESGMRLSAVVERRPERLTPFQRNNVQTYTDHRQLLNDGHIDAAIVCTEATSHRNLIDDCLSNRIPVLVEKPLAVSTGDARFVASKALSSGCTLMTGYTFLFEPAIQQASKFIAEGRLGKVCWVSSIRHGYGPVRADIGVEWDLLPHDLSIFQYWFDATPCVTAAHGISLLKPFRNDRFVAEFTYPNSVYASIDASWVSPAKRRSITIVGERSSLFIEFSAGASMRVINRGVRDSTMINSEFLSHRSASCEEVLLPAAEPLREQLRYFAECVRTGAEPLPGLEASIAITYTLEEAIRVGRTT